VNENIEHLRDTLNSSTQAEDGMQNGKLPWHHIHLMGMGGTGLSAIARALLQQGYTVSGCDRQDGAQLRSLASLGARVHVGHSPEHVQGADVLLVSSAISQENPEIQRALDAGIPVLSRRQFLSAWLVERDVVAVAGTHGKTTTTGMLVHLWRSGGRHPGYIVGAPLPRWGNADAGNEATFIIEADEYDHMFWGLQPQVGVVTNVEWDHVDCFPTHEIYKEAFAGFARRVRGTLVLCADDKGALGLASAVGVPVVTYGMNGGALWQAALLSVGPAGGMRFQAFLAGEPVGPPVTLALPGRHNVLNALAALAAYQAAGLDPVAALPHLATYRGARRRFQHRGDMAGVTVVDDYAHHPTEVRATLAAARLAFPGRRVWAVFQPHTYSRTAALLDQWRDAFADADAVVVMDIYAAREDNTLGLSAQHVLAVLDHPHVAYGGDVEATISLLANWVRPGDVVITLGAGTSVQVAEGILALLKEKITHGVA